MSDNTVGKRLGQIFQEAVSSARGRQGNLQEIQVPVTVKRSAAEQPIPHPVEDPPAKAPAAPGTGAATAKTIPQQPGAYNRAKPDYSEDFKMLAVGDIDVEDVIKKLNIIRSGKSFNSDQIRPAFEVYVASLKPNEKIALMAFLKGIADMVLGDVTGTKAQEPDEPPANIVMTRGKAKK